MTKEEVLFFEEHLRAMLLYVTSRKINDERDEAKVLHFRRSFSVLSNEVENRAAAPPDPKEVIENSISGTTKRKKAYLQNKEIKEVNMFTLKDCYIREKGNSFECRFRKIGITKSKSGKTKKEACAKMQKFLTALNKELQGVGGKLNVEENPKITRFIDIADYFIYTIKKENVAADTFQSYKSKYENYIKKPYKNCTFSELTPLRLQEDLKILRKKHSRTYEDVRMLLNGIFKYARANGLIELNPIEAIYLPPHERINGEALTPNEESRFITEIVGSPLEGIFLIMLYSGARPSEVASVQIDTEAETITIKNSKLKKYQKTKYRTLPLFPMLKRRLDTVINCKKDFSIKYINASLKKFLPNHTAKDLRHTFATRAKECGCNSEVVNFWQGHVPGSDMTAKTYTHFSMEYQKKQAKLFVY